MEARMSILLLWWLWCMLIVANAEVHGVTSSASNNASHPSPYLIAADLNMKMNESIARRGLRGCGSGNPIDDCWRCDPLWRRHRKRLAECGVGFGRNAIGGKYGKYYVVRDASDNPVKPRRGTLRHAVIQRKPLWIVFERDMTIVMKEELIMNSFKTIDGRGAAVHVAYGPCITIQGISNVIIHGIHVHDCVPAGNAMVKDKPGHIGWRTRSDGDGISIFQANNVWIDHCTLYRCTDGLIDAIEGSTALTISNNFFHDHNEVMLLGASDSYWMDRFMQVTIAFNHFGENLVQRMPRCRMGYFHIVNNDYTHWQMYAIGGSAGPTINSQGNRFMAIDDPAKKEVTKHEYTNPYVWTGWNWVSSGDQMLNGAFFTQSGTPAASDFWKAISPVSVKSSAMVPSITADAGALSCRKGHFC